MLTWRCALCCVCWFEAYESDSSHLKAQSTTQRMESLWHAAKRIRHTPNSKKVALGISNWALGSYCLALTQAKCFIVFVCPNNSFPMPNYQGLGPRSDVLTTCKAIR